jgi:hypothetical protein
MFSGSGKNIAVLSMIDRDLICLSDGAAGIVYVSKFVEPMPNNWDSMSQPLWDNCE